MNIKQYFMNGTKKKWYLQGKLLKPVYQEKIKSEKKDPIQFCNRFAEEVGKECIKSQIIAVEREVEKLETTVQEKKLVIQHLRSQKQQHAQEIWKKYDDQLQQLKERKHIFLTMDRSPLENLVEISWVLDAKVEWTLSLTKELSDKHLQDMSNYIEQFKANFKDNKKIDLQRDQYKEVKLLIDQAVEQDFSFPEIREAFKNIGLLALLLITLFFDFLLAYTVMADFFKVGTPRALDIALPFWIGIIPAQVWASVLTIMVTLILMLFFRFFHLKKEEIWEKKKYAPKTLLLYFFVILFLALWVYQSTSQGESNARNVELIFRILFIPAIFIGEVILQKMDWNVVFDMFKKLRLIPVKMQTYLGYILGKRKLSEVKEKEQKAFLDDISAKQTKAQEKVDSSQYKEVLMQLWDSVHELKEVASYIYSSYETEIRDYQDQLSKIEKDKLEAIKQGTEDISQQIEKVENADIPRLESQIKVYRQKINERIQEASQGVLEGLTEE